jgi:hypothetical protein
MASLAYLPRKQRRAALPISSYQLEQALSRARLRGGMVGLDAGNIMTEYQAKAAWQAYQRWL